MNNVPICHYHITGKHYDHPTKDIMFVRIPKNSSTWTRGILDSAGFIQSEKYLFEEQSADYKHAIVVLRDPIERWASGIAQLFIQQFDDITIDDFLYTLDIKKNLLLRLICNKVVFDGHTEPQGNFIDKLDESNCTFFKLDRSYKTKLVSFLLNEYNIKVEETTMNNDIHQADSVKSEIKNLLLKTLAENGDLLNLVKDAYNSDYKLINRVKFYD